MTEIEVTIGADHPDQQGWLTWWDGTSEFSLGEALNTPTTDCVEAELRAGGNWRLAAARRAGISACR